MRTRILSVVVGAPLVLGAIFWPGGGWLFLGWPFALFAGILIVGALHEFYTGVRSAGYPPRDEIGYIAGLIFLLSATPLMPNPAVSLRLGLTIVVILSLAVEVFRKDRHPLKSLPVTWLGAVYVGWLFPYTVRLRLFHGGLVTLPDGWMAVGEGAWILLFTMLMTGAVDTAALFVGMATGRHKMAPEVSPGKTWEGALGGVFGALLVGYLGHALLGIPLPKAMVAAALVGVVAQLGDLSKSAIKREIGIKDFGSIIPGHGGILDRFDSLLFAAPTVYWLFALWK